MTSNEFAVFAPLAILAFALALQAAGLKVEFPALLAYLERQGREGSVLIGLGMVLGFLIQLLR